MNERSRFHRLTEQLRLVGPPGPTCPFPNRDTQSRVPRSTARQLSVISKEETPQPPRSLCQCSSTSEVEKCFLVFIWNFLYSSLCPLPLALDTTEKRNENPFLNRACKAKA